MITYSSSEAYGKQSLEKQLENPVFHVHNGHPPVGERTLPFNILLNLVTVCGSSSPGVLWGFVQKYMPGTTPKNSSLLDRLVHHALAYYRDFVQPTLSFRTPNDIERRALQELLERLKESSDNASSDDLQTIVYEIGKNYPFESLRHWFQALYEVLLGQSEGPRMGSLLPFLAETTR